MPNAWTLPSTDAHLLPENDDGIVGAGQVPPGEYPEQRALSRAVLTNQEAPGGRASGRGRKGGHESAS